MYQRLFSEFAMGKMSLKNRIVQAPLYIGMDGQSQEFYDFYIERAKGGAGLLIIPQSTGDPLDSWSSKEFRDRYKAFLDRAHALGAKVALQTYEDYDINEVSDSFLEELADRYGRAAKHIEDAGFDAFDIHGAHFTPFAALFSPLRNKRPGAEEIENRMAVPLTVVKAVREAVSPGFPILYRLSASDFAIGGVTLEDSILFAKRLQEAGVTCLDVSAGSPDSPENKSLHPKKKDLPPGCFSDLAASIKKNVSIPVITVGRIDRGDLAESILEEGKADLVALGRGLIADPYWPEKHAEGRENAVRYCAYCNKGCIDDTIMQGKPIACTLNPKAGKESQQE